MHEPPRHSLKHSSMESFPRAAPPASFIVHAAPRLAVPPSSASAKSGGEGSANPNQGKRGQAKQVLLLAGAAGRKPLERGAGPGPAPRAKQGRRGFTSPYHEFSQEQAQRACCCILVPAEC